MMNMYDYFNNFILGGGVKISMNSINRSHGVGHRDNKKNVARGVSETQIYILSIIRNLIL